MEQENKPSGDSFVLADSVWHRVVQIVQEAMLMGIDVSDLLRGVRVMPSGEDPNVFVLTPEYMMTVKKAHKKLLDDAAKISAQEGKE